MKPTGVRVPPHSPPDGCYVAGYKTFIDSLLLMLFESPFHNHVIRIRTCWSPWCFIKLGLPSRVNVYITMENQ